MKNKRNIYFLVVAVISIWGYIAYKMYASLNPEDAIIMPQNQIADFKPEKIKEIEKFTINANYRDPFLGKLFTEKKSKKRNTSIKKKPIVVFPPIIYNGLIRPKESGRPILFLITINNQQQFLSVGKQIDGVKLLKGNDKEISILFQTKRNIIAIQK